MHQNIVKPFVGMTNAYYFRQLLFGLIFPLVLFLIASSAGVITLDLITLLVINTLLYPHARFAYERVVKMIIGDAVPEFNPLWLAYWRFATMALCWALALFIGPLGLGLAIFYYCNLRAR